MQSLSTLDGTENVPVQKGGNNYKAPMSLIMGSVSLKVKKTYASVSAMNSDNSPVGNDGQPLNAGDIVSIYNPSDAADPDNNSIYTYMKPGWTQSGKLSQADSELSETSVNPVENRVVTGSFNGFKKQISPTMNAFVKDLVESTNLFDISDPDIINGSYMNKNGQVVASPNLSVTGFIEVESGQAYIFGTDLGSGGPYYRFLTAFDDSKNVVSSAGNNDGSHTYFEIPEGVKYVRITYNTSWKNLRMNKGTEILPYEEYFAPYYKINFESVHTEDFEEYIYKKTRQGNSNFIMYGKLSELGVGDKIELEENNIKNNKHLVFCARVVTMGQIKISHDTDWLIIDSTHIYRHQNSDSPLRSYAHGLTIQNNIQVKLSVNDSGYINIKLQSQGQTYERTDWNWLGDMHTIYVESISAELTSCVLSWTTDGYKKDIHLYGDSYFGNFNPARWVTWLVKDGYAHNALIDGYSGRGSVAAYNAFERNLAHSIIPKYVVWCMGMNDPDSESAISDNWKNSVESFIAKCEDYGITPILATIPCTPTRNHTFKNAYVRGSGYRYVDFAEAVNGVSTGSSWYSGMLNQDNVHPNETGAKALYMRFIADFPEIMSNNYLNEETFTPGG